MSEESLKNNDDETSKNDREVKSYMFEILRPDGLRMTRKRWNLSIGESSTLQRLRQATVSADAFAFATSTFNLHRNVILSEKYSRQKAEYFERRIS